MLIAFLPTFILSGFIFPIASMPTALQYITAARARAVLPDRAARRRAEGARAPDLLAAARRAGASTRRSCSACRRCGWPADESAHPHADPEGVPRAPADAAADRPDHRRADPAADAARVCRDHRRPATCPIVVVDGDRSRPQPAADRAFSASPYFEIVARGAGPAGGRSAISRRGRAWLAIVIPRGFAGRDRAGRSDRQPAAGSDPGRRHRRQLVRRRAVVRDVACIGGVQPRRLEADAARAASGRHRRTRPRVVQPRAREQGLHGARRAGAAAARHHGEPVVDGDRARARAGHARAVERHAARPLGADPRQAAAVRARRLHRRPAGRCGRRVLVRGAAPGQLWLLLLGGERRLPALHAWPGPVRLDDLGDAAAGDDDGDVLLPGADDVPLGVHLPDREHAAP